MLKKVTLALNNLEPETWTDHEVEDLCAFLKETFGDKFPDTAHVYHQAVSLLTDVTPKNSLEIEKLQEMPGPFFVVVYPGYAAIPYIIALVLAVGAYLLMPGVPKIPTLVNPVLGRNQQSASPNNELSDRQNQPRINGRIPDIFGQVRSTPDLIAAPYKVFENNREVEYAYMCIGRGEYDITKIKDGETAVEDIPGTSVMIYGPYNSPNNYDPSAPTLNPPQLTVGQFRQVPVLATKRSNSVNGQVLRPPNEVFWTSTDQGQVKFVYPNKIVKSDVDPQDFTKYFVEGDVITVSGATMSSTAATGSNVQFKAANHYDINYPGGTKVYVATGESALMFPATYIDMMTKGLNTDDSITLDTGSVTSIGDIDGTYNVGTKRIVGPTTPAEQSAKLPTFYIVDVPGASGVNANWNNIVGAVGYESFISFSASGFDINLNGVYIITSVTRDTITLDNPNATASDWEDVLSVHLETDFLNASISATGSKWVGPFILEDPELIEVYSNFFATNGLYKDDGTDQTAAEITVELELTPVDNDDAPLADPELFQLTLVGSTFLKESVGATLIAHPTFFGRCSVRARRITEADTTFVGQVVDEVRWKDAYSVANVDKREFGNVTTVMSITLATASALAVKERKLNMLVTRKVPTRIGTTSTFTDTVSTSLSAADILCAVCRDQYIGNRSLAEIDVSNIYDTMAEVGIYFGTADMANFCYSFDSANLSFEETVQTICQAVFSVAYRRGNVIRVSFEKENANSTLLFNHRNKVPGSEKRTVSFGLNDNNDGIEYTYVDPADDSINTIFLPPDHAAINPKRIESIGVRDHLQAYFHAWRIWNRLQFQRMQVEFEATQEAELLVVNDHILVSDGTRPNIQDGEVEAVVSLELTLSQNVDLTTDPPYTIFLQHYDGTVESRTITAGSASNKVVLGTAPSLPLVTDPSKYAKTGYLIVGDSG